MKGITTEFTEEVRAANSIQDVLRQFVPGFQGFDEAAASQLKCACPFPQCGDASFTVYVDDQSYYCFGCGRRGDVFDLIRELKGVDFIQARNMLADRAGIRKPELPHPDAQLELELRAMGDVLGTTADFYHQALVRDSAWEDKIKGNQALRDIAKERKTGVARGSDLAGHLASKGFDIELAKKAGVINQDSSDFFEGRMVIPYFDKGRVVHMSGENLDGSKLPRYLDLPVTELVKRALPIAEALQRPGKLIIVEGFADALCLKKKGYNAVPLAGMALSEQELQFLRGHDAIYLWPGCDGFETAMTIGKRIARQAGVVPYLVELPWGVKDPDRWRWTPRGYAPKSCEQQLGQSRDLVAIMLEHIRSCQGADRENEVREFFACICSLSDSDISGYREKAIQSLDSTYADFRAYLKGARKRERTSVNVRAEDVPEGSCLAIHPALDYLEQMGVVSVALDVIIDNRVVARPYLITSDRQRLEPDGAGLQMGGQRVLFRSEPKAPCEKRWRKADIDRFLAGDAPDPGQTFSGLLDIVKRHIDFRDPVEAEILAIWCMASYLFPLFTSYPYLHLYGFKGTGKTQTMRLASKLAFNMVLASGITPSATFRLVQSSRCCVGLDEAENLRGARDQDSRELLGLLRAGCKKGAAAIRAEAVPDRGLMPIQYDVYSPKMIASIDPIEDILGSRCISINMLRTKNPEIGRVELSDNGEDWAGMRHELYCFALNHFHEVRQLYTDEVSLRILLNRDNELWLPLFSVAKLLAQRGADGLLDRLVEYARVASAEASDSGLEEFDLALMEVLVSLAGKDGAEAKWIAAKELERHVRQVLAGSHLPRDVPQTIGYSLRNLGLLHSPRSKKRTAEGMMYSIQPGQLMSACDRWGIAPPTEPDAEEAEPAAVTGSGAQPGPKRSKTHKANRQ